MLDFTIKYSLYLSNYVQNYSSYVYSNHIIYFTIALGLSMIILGISVLSSTCNWYFEKISSYECGFDPFSDTREPFEMKFYLIAILFIIFDVEVVFFMPWVICLKHINVFGYYIMYIFVIQLLLGFLYEYRKGVLDWN